MRNIDNIRDLDPTDPADALVALDTAITSTQALITVEKIAIQRRATGRTSRSPKAVKLARRS